MPAFPSLLAKAAPATASGSGYQPVTRPKSSSCPPSDPRIRLKTGSSTSSGGSNSATPSQEDLLQNRSDRSVQNSYFRTCDPHQSQLGTIPVPARKPSPMLSAVPTPVPAPLPVPAPFPVPPPKCFPTLRRETSKMPSECIQNTTVARTNSSIVPDRPVNTAPKMGLIWVRKDLFEDTSFQSPVQVIIR